MSILQGNSCSIDQKSGEIWTVQTDLQQIYPKSDRLLGRDVDACYRGGTMWIQGENKFNVAVIKLELSRKL